MHHLINHLLPLSAEPGNRYKQICVGCPTDVNRYKQMYRYIGLKSGGYIGNRFGPNRYRYTYIGLRSVESLRGYAHIGLKSHIGYTCLQTDISVMYINTNRYTGLVIWWVDGKAADRKSLRKCLG